MKVISKKTSISTSQSLTGVFSIDETVGTNTSIAIRSPIKGLFTVTITDPSGEVMSLPNEPEMTNWNSPNSIVGLTWVRIPNPAVS